MEIDHAEAAEATEEKVQPEVPRPPRPNYLPIRRALVEIARSWIGTP